MQCFQVHLFISARRRTFVNDVLKDANQLARLAWLDRSHGARRGIIRRKEGFQSKLRQRDVHRCAKNHRGQMKRKTWAPNLLGQNFTVMQVIAVGVFAELQSIGLRKSTETLAIH
jgi:hypothetical protein